MDKTPKTGPLARNVKLLSHVDMPGAGQVYVAGGYAYIGHLPNEKRIGTSIPDVSDPRKPRVVSQIHLDDPESHSHKARVVGDIMIVNHERNMMTSSGNRRFNSDNYRNRLTGNDTQVSCAP